MHAIRFAGAALVSAGLVVAAPATAIADDSKTVRGSCSGTSKYVDNLRDLDDDKLARDDRLRARFAIDGKRSGVAWKVTIKRNGKVVHRQTKKANRQGNVVFTKAFRGDDDRVQVLARAAYGEKCSRTRRLDD